MGNMRILVTLMTIFGLGCTGHSNIRNGALVDAGNAALSEALTVQAQLQEKFSIALDQVTTKDSIQHFNWKGLSKSERRVAQGELAHYLSLINRVLEIDSHKNITILRRERLLSARDQAELYQKAIESFEHSFGENYEPKHDLGDPQNWHPQSRHEEQEGQSNS